MCGIVGIVATRGRPISLDERTVARLRDRLAHRGPDAATLVHAGTWALGHRLLAIRDPGAYPQPAVIRRADGSRLAVVYNGELYGTEGLAQELRSAGRVPRTRSDAELVALALDAWGADALRRFRGMFALGAVDERDGTLLLARDPFGIKPLHWAIVDGTDGREIAFASEPAALLDHPRMPIQPDWAGVSAYLTTIRLTLGRRTLFRDVRTVLPGEAVTFDLRAETPAPRFARHWIEPRVAERIDPDAARETRRVVADSICAHLVSDRPVAALLSGGLDSTIMASLVARERRDLATWCSGDPDAGPDGDLAHARRVAAGLGTRHGEAPIDRATFAALWPAMIDAMGLPLGTPNETAIYAVAAALGAEAPVALSGEGADELFAGYALPQSRALAYAANPRTESGAPLPPESFFLDLVSWVPMRMKAVLLDPAVVAETEGDRALRAWYAQEYAESGDPATLEAHLRVQRRFNLAGLLGRLDTATMLASVEGRTPFADRVVAEHALAQPAAAHFADDAGPDDANDAAVSVLAPPTVGKRLLRAAFADVVPPEILARPKASFPLPFAEWLADEVHRLDRPGPAAQVIGPAARALVASDPARHWRLAWPLVNLAIWLDRWWG